MHRLVLVVGLVYGVTSARAEPKAPEPIEPVEPVEENDPPPADGLLESTPHLDGPRLVDLGASVEIDLPAGMALIEGPAARAMMIKNGDDPTGVVAVVVKPNTQWMAVLEYDGIGYVADDEADELDADGMLETIKQGTIGQNAKRKQLGVAELVVDAWSEAPHYVAAQHHLVWGLAAHSTEGKVINFMTRILGRTGYIAVNLIDGPDTIAASKLDAAPILAATHFRTGARYQDHVSSDRDSGIGLRGLVLGGAGLGIAAKTGFLVKLLLVLKKGFIAIIAAIGGGWRWLTRRKKTVAVTEPPPTETAPSDDPPAV